MTEDEQDILAGDDKHKAKDYAIEIFDIMCWGVMVVLVGSAGSAIYDDIQEMSVNSAVLAAIFSILFLAAFVVQFFRLFGAYLKSEKYREREARHRVRVQINREKHFGRRD